VRGGDKNEKTLGKTTRLTGGARVYSQGSKTNLPVSRGAGSLQGGMAATLPLESTCDKKINK